MIETSIKMEPWNFYQNGNLLFSISLLSEWAPISIRIEKLLSGTDRNHKKLIDTFRSFSVMFAEALLRIFRPDAFAIDCDYQLTARLLFRLAVLAAKVNLRNENIGSATLVLIAEKIGI